MWSSPSSARVILATCGLVAAPHPATDSLTCNGVYELIATPPRASASRMTPRASLTCMALRRLLAKNSSSTAAASGRYIAISFSMAAKSPASRSPPSTSGEVSTHAAWTRLSAPTPPSMTATPVRASPGSTPRTLTSTHRRQHVVGDLGVRVHLLDVVVLLQGVEKPDHRRRLPGVELHRLARIHGDLGGGDGVPRLLDHPPRLLEMRRRHA